MEVAFVAVEIAVIEVATEAEGVGVAVATWFPVWLRERGSRREPPAVTEAKWWKLSADAARDAHRPNTDKQTT